MLDLALASLSCSCPMPIPPGCPSPALEFQQGELCFTGDSGSRWVPVPCLPLVSPIGLGAPAARSICIRYWAPPGTAMIVGSQSSLPAPAPPKPHTYPPPPMLKLWHWLHLLHLPFKNPVSASDHRCDCTLRLQDT